MMLGVIVFVFVEKDSGKEIGVEAEIKDVD